ncbi:hypothetical protein AUM47_19615 [Cronobacter malonaticus]|nr:hypothetical protein [Cronobacter malonaticus]HAU5449431.1 hypothetical protein [Cronobacter malonaticus]
MRKTVWAATLLALTPISYGYATIASTSAAMTAAIAAANASNAASQQAQNSATQTSAVNAPIIQSGNTLPASYDANAVSFDHYNGVATVYFSY